MPDRVLRQGILKSEAVNGLSWPAEVFYRRLMSVVDDFGRYDGRAIILRSDLYPLKVDKVSVADVGKWKAECASAGLVSCYTVAGKEFMEIKNFGQRLRAMKSRYPGPADSCQQMPADDSICPPESESEYESETETEKNRAKALAGKPAVKKFDSEDTVLKNEFKALVIPETPMEAWPIIKAWIADKAPQFIDPYVVAWNVFATVYRLPSVSKINDSRRRKFSVRIKEDGFEFIGILAKARESNLLRESSWFTFDWIIENDKNYLKVLEGNYK